MLDYTILNACLHNEPWAQRELFNQYSPILLGVCYRYANSREDAEDMLQEGFIKIFSQLQSFENRGSFEGWMRRVIVHTCINYIKRNKKFQQHIDVANAYNIEVKEESIASKLLGKQVMECIRLLPLGYRTVLNLYAIEGYSHKEVGELLEIGESTSRSQFTRAKVILENILIQKGLIDNPNKLKELYPAFNI